MNDEFGEWAQRKYGGLKPVSIVRGKIHQFLGMTLDFTKPGEVHVRQKEHVEDIISTWPENLSDKKSLTPASNDLFKKGHGRLLNDQERETFHSVVAKCIYIGNRSRPDILPTISVLAGRVQKPNVDDWKKGRKLIRYLQGSIEEHLVLRYDGLAIANWYVDAAFAVHDDFKSQSGGILFFGKNGGGVTSGSVKQRLNTRSSTEAELVGADDFLAKILWTQRFLGEQGIEMKRNVLYQDNKSAILLETKGRSSLGKRSRAINIRFFAIKDSCEKGELEISYCPTEDMVADFYTKPLQGKKFRQFRKLILGDDTNGDEKERK